MHILGAVADVGQAWCAHCSALPSMAGGSSLLDWSEAGVREKRTYTFALSKLGCYSSSNHIMPGSIISNIEI